MWLLVSEWLATTVLAELNLQLQGKDQLCSSMFERITSFTNKLELFIAQLKAGKIVHFRSLSGREKKFSVTMKNILNYVKICLESLQLDFVTLKRLKLSLNCFMIHFHLNMIKHQ